jgi:hypothetical protein
VGKVNILNKKEILALNEFEVELTQCHVMKTLQHQRRI